MISIYCIKPKRQYPRILQNLYFLFFAGVTGLLGHVHPDGAEIVSWNAQAESRTHHTGYGNGIGTMVIGANSLKDCLVRTCVHAEVSLSHPSGSYRWWQKATSCVSNTFPPTTFHFSLGTKDEDAPEDLLSLSPYEMRNLLHHLMNGEEFLVEREKTGYCIVSEQNTVSKVQRD